MAWHFALPLASHKSAVFHRLASDWRNYGVFLFFSLSPALSLYIEPQATINTRYRPGRLQEKTTNAHTNEALRTGGCILFYYYYHHSLWQTDKTLRIQYEKDEGSVYRALKILASDTGMED